MIKERSYLVIEAQEVRTVKEVIRSDGLWLFPCGNVLYLYFFGRLVTWRVILVGAVGDESRGMRIYLSKPVGRWASKAAITPPSPTPDHRLLLDKTDISNPPRSFFHGNTFISIFLSQQTCSSSMKFCQSFFSKRAICMFPEMIAMVMTTKNETFPWNELGVCSSSRDRPPLSKA